MGSKVGHFAWEIFPDKYDTEKFDDIRKDKFLVLHTVIWMSQYESVIHTL